MNADEGSTILEEFARLSKQKDAIEAEIAAIADELTSGPNAAGLRGPLVDAEGFPRADIDVYRVRHQRHTFACKQTDHRMIMESIEKLLPLLFEARKVATKTAPAQPPTPPASSTAIPVADATDQSAATSRLADTKKREPFAVMESVQEDSPAALADLRAGDLVLSFGTADATNHRNLEAIREIVMRNIGSAIRVVVLRPLGGEDASLKQAVTGTESLSQIHELSLTPQKWHGAGVLGSSCRTTRAVPTNLTDLMTCQSVGSELMGVFKQVWEVYKENGCELTLHRSIATHLGSGSISAASDVDAAAVAAFVAELEGFLRDPETFLLMLSVGLRGMFDTQSSFIGLLLREDALQASLIDFLLEKLSELASDLDGALEKNFPKLILREIRWIDHVVDSAELVEKLTTALHVFPTPLQRDVIYILPEIAGDADAYKVIDSMLELIRNEADLVVCCIEALGNFNVVNEQTNDVVKCVLERLNSSPLMDLPVIVKYLVQEAPGADVDLIAGELREKLSATLSFTDRAAETTNGNGRRSSTGSSAGVDPTRNEEALVLGAIIQGFYFREDLLKAFLASMSKSGTDKGAGGLCLLDMWILFGAHSIPRDRQKVERLFKKKIASGGISRSMLVKSVKGHAIALKSYFRSTLQLASVLLSQQKSGICTEMGSLMFEVLFEEFSLSRKDGKNEAEYYKGEIVNSLLSFCLSAANETTDAAFKTLSALVSPQVTFASELRDRRYELSHFKRRHRFQSLLPTLKQLLDVMEINTTDQVRHAYEVLFAVGGAEDAELLNTTRKQTSHQETRYRECGILGAVAQMNQLLLQHSENAATRANHDVSSTNTDDRQAAEAFMKSVKGLLQLTLSQGGCVDFLLREIRRWVTHLNLDHHSKILVDIVSNHAMELLENRFMDGYSERLAQSGKYRKVVLGGALKADTWFSLDGQASSLYLKILDLSTSPNVRDQESLHFMAPLVELVLECTRKSGKLDTVDCILVCPIQMMENSVVEDISGLDEMTQNAVCGTVWHTINWLRAIVNFYAGSTHRYHQEKVFERLKNMLQMESVLLDDLLDSCPQFGPPGNQLTTSARRPSGKGSDAIKKKPGRRAKISQHAERRMLIRGSFDPFRADVLKMLTSDKLWDAIVEQSATNHSDSTDSIRPHTMVEALVSAFENFAVVEHQTTKTADRSSVFDRIFSGSLGWSSTEETEGASACTAHDVLRAMCKYAHHFVNILQKSSEEDGDCETDPAMQRTAKRIIRAYLQIGSILIDTTISTNSLSTDVSPVRLCQDFYLPKDQHVLLQQGVDEDIRSQVLESCFLAAIKFSSVVNDDIELATTLLRALLSIAGVTYGFPAHDITNQAMRLHFKRAKEVSSGSDMSAKISSMALSYLQQDWSGGDKKFVYKNADLDVILSCFLYQGEVMLDNVQELAIDGILALTENGGKEVVAFPSLTKKTMATFHRAMFDALVAATVRLDFAASSSEDTVVLLLNYFTQAVLLFRILVGMTKSFQKPRIVATVLKQGRKFVEIVVGAMPMFKKHFLDHNESIMKIIAEVQVATRRMQVLCAHGKLIKDASAATQVPMVKRLLERFIYKAEELAREHGVLDAFSTGVLKNKRIDGTTINKRELEAMEANNSDSGSDGESEPEEQESDSSTDEEVANGEPDDDDDDEQPPQKSRRQHK